VVVISSFRPPTPSDALVHFVVFYSSTSSLDINDAIFCEHGKEVCTACSFDAREGEHALELFSVSSRAEADGPLVGLFV